MKCKLFWPALPDLLQQPQKLIPFYGISLHAKTRDNF